MNQYVTAETIRNLREKKGYTQKALAEILCVSDKTVSKWETGRGLPDISVLDALSRALGISVAELLKGECIVNTNRSANMRRGQFYVCPVCGNVIFATGNAAISCCGVSLPPLSPLEVDEECGYTLEKIDGDHYLALDHPMTKEHYISFIAYITGDRAQILKLYPEQSAEGRFQARGHGMIVAYCNRHGFCMKAKV